MTTYNPNTSNVSIFNKFTNLTVSLYNQDRKFLLEARIYLHRNMSVTLSLVHTYAQRSGTDNTAQFQCWYSYAEMDSIA